MHNFLQLHANVCMQGQNNDPPGLGQKCLQPSFSVKDRLVFRKLSAEHNVLEKRQKGSGTEEANIHMKLSLQIMLNISTNFYNLHKIHEHHFRQWFCPGRRSSEQRRGQGKQYPLPPLIWQNNTPTRSLEAGSAYKID